MICTASVAALNASFQVSPGGTAYSAVVEVSGTGEYSFWNYGLLGERIPQQVTNVSLQGSCGNCSFDWIDPFTMNFTPGNYTVSYDGQISGNQLQGNFDSPYHVSVILPEGLDVRDPVLGMISPGSEITENGSSLTVEWNSTNSFSLRFYDPGRERLLIIFGVTWLAALVIALVPYYLSRRKLSRELDEERGPP